jgi:hypothetical protein
MTLKNFADECGITTYNGILNHCDRLGVVPPTQSEFDDALGTQFVSNPMEGVVVLEPASVVLDHNDDTKKKKKRSKTLDDAT